MVRIKDVAERCGLSIASVSKALNGKSDLNPKTVEYICGVAKEMGYIPNATARVLKTNRSYNIGILFVDTTSSGLEHEYFSSILNAVKEESEKNGFDITFISNHVGNDYLTYYEHAKYRNCDGVIIASVDFHNPQVVKLVESEIPTVTIDYEFNGKSSVISDNISGLRDIVNYVVENGHRKIAFIHGENTDVTQKRLASFYKTCLDNGIEVDERFVKQGVYHLPQASGIATRELLSLDDKPTCIIYPDDYSLLGGLTEIEKHGLSVPNDISIVGYDGIRLSRLFRPELTTYIQDSKQIGILAAKKLVEIIQNPKSSIPERIVVEGKLQKGSTVGSLIK